MRVCKCMCIYVKMYIEVLSVVRGPMCMLKKSMLLCAPRNSLCIHSYFPEHHACSEAQYSLQKQITDIPLKGGGGRKEEVKRSLSCEIFYGSHSWYSEAIFTGGNGVGTDWAELSARGQGTTAHVSH